MSKLTKIIATIGPVTESEDKIRELISAGMNVARFNTKHSDPEWHNSRIQRVIKVAREMERSVAILLDLQGPEVRINLPESKSFSIKKGESVVFTADLKTTAPRSIIIPANVITAMRSGQEIVLEDGACEFTVTETQPNSFSAQAHHDCTVNHRKTLNTPGIVLDNPSLTERDFEYLDKIDPKDIDFVGLSFVRNTKDIALLREALAARKYTAHVIAKLENQDALNNLLSIIDASDGLMVARGDLGVEVAYEELIYWQKQIVTQARLAGKPVIIATQMLQSMTERPRPSRAEISDVAHAIFDGADAIMLSEETAMGQYPVKAVSVQNRIAEFNEPHVEHHQLEILNNDGTETIAEAAVSLVENSSLEFDKIVCLTETGRTARLIARWRPYIPVHAITSTPTTARQLSLAFGVTPHLIKLPEKRLALQSELLEKLVETGAVEAGDKIVLVYGTFWRQPGLTNSITIMDIPQQV